jgi:cytoskeleton protein RodZ
MPDAVNQTDDPSSISTASTYLRDAREAMGMSQLQVAEELYLTPSYITKIDEDRIHEIPKQAFVKGYLRSYARVVKLDGDQIVAMYERLDTKSIAPPSMRSVTEEPVGPITFTGPVLQTGVIGLAGLILIILAVWYYSEPEFEPASELEQTGSFDSNNSAQNSMAGSRQALESSMSSNDTARSDNETDGATINRTDNIDRSVFADYGDTNSDLTEQDAQSQLNQKALQAQEQVDTLTQETSDAESAIESVVNDNLDEDFEGDRDQSFSSELASLRNRVVTESESESGSGKLVSVGRETIDGTRFINVTAGGDAELHFTFADECWVEVEDADGDAIFGDLGRQGDDLRVLGKAPFDVLFGNAPAVTMAFNGESVNLSQSTKSDNTAKLRVGES